MSEAPLMPMATAVWLLDNTSLTFKQIANFCKLHEVEVKGIADGEVAKGIVGYNPIISGQLTKEEIELSSADTNRALNLQVNEIQLENDFMDKVGWSNFLQKCASKWIELAMNKKVTKFKLCFTIIG